MDYLNELLTELKTDLAIELSDTVGYSENLLENKIKSEVREVIYLRGYSDGYTEDMILQDLKNLYPLIRGRIRYEWNTIGAEGESEHSENGTKRTFVSKNKLYPILKLSAIV